MGYRTFEHKPKPPRRTMQKTTTPHRVYLHNGTCATLAIPCFYQIAHEPIRMKPHNRPTHDHMGWPDPRRRDRSCQLYEPYEAGYPPEPEHTHMGGHPPVRKLLDLNRLIPIHLASKYESGERVSVRTFKDESLKDVRITAQIDPDHDWVIQVFIAPTIADPTEPVRGNFSVFVETPYDRSLVSLGELIVLPALYREPE